jgi:two-component system NtrC family sensor kinase
MNLIYSYITCLVLTIPLFVSGSTEESHIFNSRSLKQFNLGISGDTSLIQIRIGNHIDDEDLFLVVLKANVDYLEVRNITKGMTIKAGQTISYLDNENDDPYSYCKVNANDELEIRVYSNEQIVLPVSLDSKSGIDLAIFTRNIFSGIFIGLMGGLFLYNLVLFFFLRERTYFYYVFYLLFIALAQLDIIGFNFFLFRDYPVVYNSIMHFSSGISGIFAMLFLQRLMHTKLEIPWGHKLLGFIALVYLLVVLFTLLGFDIISYRLIQVGALSLPVAMVIAYKLAFQGNKTAMYVAASWSVLTIGLILYTFKDFGLIPFNSFTNYTLTVGVSLEAILLSLALANKITLLNDEKQVANHKVLEQIEKNEELVKNQNVVLERKVSERTAALQKALDDLKAAQSQLVQSEKMASLGTLTAGIAHEINNPINFVSANVLPLRDNINELTRLIQEYKGLNESNYEIELVRLAEVEKEMDLEYTLIETKQLIDGIEEGAKRTHTIVQGLTSFSRGDSGKKSEADINRGIRSTVSVLKSRLNNVNLIMDLDNNLPLVSCQIGKINQVVLNLINNALDALVEKNGTNRKESQLRVETKGLGHSVQISISDNANGIEKELQPKIMEPFYTTKPVGKGTGLGLSISYSIIEDHGGAIELDSEEGVGTKFIITLPLVS